MRKINQKQIESLLALPGHKRYSHFIKAVADTEEAWGLYQNGWALAANDNEETVFPLWPAKEYAQLCATGAWSGYEPSSIPLSDLIEELLPKLQEQNVMPGVFYTSGDKGVTVNAQQLLQDLNEELKRYS